MVKNNLPVWYQENFSVRPEFIEGWTKKFHPVAASHSCFDKALLSKVEGLSTNGLRGEFAISGSYLLTSPYLQQNKFAALVDFANVLEAQKVRHFQPYIDPKNMPSLLRQDHHAQCPNSQDRSQLISPFSDSLLVVTLNTRQAFQS